MKDQSQPIGPILAEERIAFIDILRGFALFGVLAANMRAFSAPLQIYEDIGKLFPGMVDAWTQGVIDTLISGKFVTLFSFLFGMGFAVQFSRAEAKGANFNRYYPRRLAALAMFGLIHGIVIWAGDILLSYAIGGFLLLSFRRAKQQTLFVWFATAIGAGALATVGFYVAALYGFHEGGPPRGPDMQQIHRIIGVYARGNPWEILRQNWYTWLDSLQFVAFGVLMTFVFLMGLYVWRIGLVQNLTAHRDLLNRVCAWTLPVGLVLNIAAVLTHNVLPKTQRPTFLELSGNLSGVIGIPILSCGYASSMALLYLNPNWRPRLRPFASVGRMALTNYLTESVVCVLFYSALVTGLYGRVGPALGLIPTLVLYTIQVYFSKWWLARFRFGPMEWLWRGLTYGEFPAMHPPPGAVAQRMTA